VDEGGLDGLSELEVCIVEDHPRWRWWQGGGSEGELLVVVGLPGPTSHGGLGLFHQYTWLSCNGQ